MRSGWIKAFHTYCLCNKQGEIIAEIYLGPNELPTYNGIRYDTMEHAMIAVEKIIGISLESKQGGSK